MYLKVVLSSWPSILFVLCLFGEVDAATIASAAVGFAAAAAVEGSATVAAEFVAAEGKRAGIQVRPGLAAASASRSAAGGAPAPATVAAAVETGSPHSGSAVVAAAEVAVAAGSGTAAPRAAIPGRPRWSRSRKSRRTDQNSEPPPAKDTKYVTFNKSTNLNDI